MPHCKYKKNGAEGFTIFNLTPILLSFVHGYGELTLLPLTEFKYVYINAKQSRIYKITLNDNVELQFAYFDPCLNLKVQNM